jgi:hypothetical protein
MKRRLIAFLGNNTVVIAAAALLCGGCATASKPEAMIAAPVEGVTAHPESVSITVTGGSETSAMVASDISNADFAEALRASIVQSKLFAKVLAGEQSDYQLQVHIARLERPMFGASFTVKLETSWQLRRRSDATIVWEKAITSSFTANMGDAFVGVTRLRLANEGAARSNIRDAIAQMSRLSL